MIYGRLLHACGYDREPDSVTPEEDRWARADADGWSFVVGTPVECNEFDSIEDLMREQLFGASAGTYWLLPNGEERCLEPDVVDFGAGI